MTDADKSDGSDLLIELTAEIVAAYVSNNSVAANDLPGVICTGPRCIGRDCSPQAEDVMEKPKPAVSGAPVDPERSSGLPGGWPKVQIPQAAPDVAITG
jgi:predicted transcriptional regulator